MADGEKRIIELEELTTLTDNDYIAVDNSASGGKTKKFKPKNLQDATNQVLEDVAYLTWEEDHYYNRGDIVAYEGYLYVCKVDEATYGSFERSDWKKTYVERWGRDLFFDISSQEMTFSDSEYTLPYSKGDVVYRYYPHPSNDGFEMRFYVAKADYPNGVTEYVASQWDEYYSLSEVVDALNKETNKSVDEALAEGTASGDIASFTDGSTLPMKNLEVAIEPVQDLHGYDNPWVGGSGKNKCDNKDATTNSNGTVNLTTNGTYGDVVAGTTYAFSFDVLETNAQAVQVRLNNTNNSITGGSYTAGTLVQGTRNTLVFTPSESGTINFWANTNAFTASKKVIDNVQLEVGNQATTYQPYENICPISGWDECNVSDVGKNLCEGSNNFLISYSAQTGVATRITGTGTCLVTHVKEGYTYTFSNGENVNRRIVTYWDSTPNIGDSTNYAQSLTGNTFTAIKDGLVIIYIYNASVDTSVAQIELNSEATTYEPYNGSTYTITFQDGSTPLTVYGGKLNVTTGVLTVDRVYKDMGTLIWTKESWGSGGVDFYTPLTGAKLPPNNDTKGDIISSQYENLTRNEMYNSSSNGISLLPGGVLKVRDSRYVEYDAIQFKTAMSGVQLVYELATPQTYQLTPTEVKTLLGQNNIFADTGQVNDATYVRNANITINDLIRRIEALES